MTNIIHGLISDLTKIYDELHPKLNYEQEPDKNNPNLWWPIGIIVYSINKQIAYTIKSINKNKK